MAIMSDRTNRFTRHNGVEKIHNLESDLLAALIDTPGKAQTGLDSIPAEVLELIETTNRLRSLELPAPRPAFRTALRAQLMRQLASSPKPATLSDVLAKQWYGFTAGLKKRTTQMAMASLAALIVALAGSGTAYASQSSLPGDPLYGVKVGIESAQLALASEEKDHELYLDFMERRLNEIEALVQLGRYDDIATAAQSFMDQYAHVAEDSDSEELESTESNAINALTKVMSQVPDQARPTIQRVLEKIAEKQGIDIDDTDTEAPEKPGKPNPMEAPGNKPTEKPKTVPTEKPKENKPESTPAAPNKPAAP